MAQIGHKIVGSGIRPVLVMHEWLGDHRNYDPVLPYLNTEDFTWIFVDLRGYGLSRHLQGSFTCREAADDVILLADRLHLKTFDLIGHSMSAMIAQRIAADIPKRISTLVLVSPVPASGVSLSDAATETLGRVARDDAIAMDAIDARTGGRYTQSWLSAKLSMARSASVPQARLGYLDMFLNTDFSQDVAGLDVPVRVIVGEHDIPVFQKGSVQAVLVPWFKDIRVITCRQAGHYPMLECPVYFASAVERFLNEERSGLRLIKKTSSGIRIRNLDPSDYGQIISVVNEWWGGRPMAGMLPKLFFEHFRDTSFVAEKDGGIGGFLVGFVSQTFPNEAYIHFMGVAPDCRRRNFGRSLYERFFDTVKAAGCHRVRCVTSPVNKASIAFHKRMGFSVIQADKMADGAAVAENYDGPGEDRVLFLRNLRVDRPLE